MSAIGWIDWDAADRDRTQRLLQLFGEQETRDELGLGAIRDSISDRLFPGTSTIQTRLRYMLFIPWIFDSLAIHRNAREIVAQARQDQIRLRNALVAGKQDFGIIGRDAGPNLKRLPASVYWSGLENWGIRRFPGSINAYAEALPLWPRGGIRDHEQDDHGTVPRANMPWHPRLPTPPSNFLDITTFEVSDEEASFIIDRLVDRHPGSLLTFLAGRGDATDSDAAWTHPHLADFPADVRKVVIHAETFSGAMYAAALLYNLMLSELRNNEEWIEHYEQQLAAWRNAFDMARLKAWSLDAFWAESSHPGHRVLDPTRRFVSEWVDLLLATRGLSGDRSAAGAYVKNREQRLKRGQSRFANRSARDRWQGASGAYRLQFRWPQAKRYLQDLKRG